MCTENIQNILAGTLILICLFALVGLLLIHKRLASSRYMPEVSNQYALVYELLIALYCILYSGLFIWVIVRSCFSKNKRVCSKFTFTFMLVSIGFIAFGGQLCQMIGEEAYNMSEDMNS